MKTKAKFRKNVARSFVFYILIFSSFAAVISTSIQLFFEYKRDINTIEKTAHQIENSHKSTISQALWTYDIVVLESQLQGIKKFPGVLYACVKKKNEILKEIGPKHIKEKFLSYQYVLTHIAKNEPLQLGTLEVQINLSDVYKRLWDRVIVILLTQTLKTFFVSIFILFLFYSIVGRHLNSMADFAKSINLNNLEGKFVLNRKSGKNIEFDELGVVESALNRMRVRLLGEIKKVRLTQEALKRSEERFKLAMEFANDGLFDWNLETNEIYYSPVWKRMLGYEDDELPNDFSVWESLTEPEDVKRSWEMQNELINKKRDKFEIEFKMRHKDGHWVDILSRANAIYDENDKAIRIIGTHVDITERKNVQIAILKSEQKYRHLIQTASDAIYLITEDGRFSDVNPAACSMLNRSRKEILNFDINAIDPNFSVEAFNNFWKETPLNEPRVFETTHLHKDGSLVPVEVSGQKFQVGEDVYFFGIARNITDRKKAEAHLRKSQLIIESTSDAIISTDVNGIITFWNSGAERLYGYKFEEVLNKSINLIYKEEDLPISQNLIADLIQGKDLLNENVTCIDKEGNDVEILLSLMTIKDENQDVIEIVGFTKDISELKRYEKEIIKQKERAERYLNLAGVIFIALNRNGEVTLINKKGCETLGCNYAEVIGKNWFENFIPEWLRDDLLPISKQLLNGDIESVEYYENPILTKNGKEKLIAWHNTILKDETGDIIGHLSAGDDITEKRQMEKQLQQAQKMESIGTLAGGIAHDFNNILYMISGNAELAIEEIPASNPAYENLKEIKFAVSRAADVVKQLLNFSRLTDHGLKPICAGIVIKDALKFLRSIIPTSIEIQQKFPDKEVSILGDPTQINQVMMNLCINAAQAMEETGGGLEILVEVIILTERENDRYSDLTPGDWLKITVRDSGSGISPDNIDRIFDPYFTTKEVGKGSGMGLAVVHGIIKNHHGRIFVDSKLGQGTAFTILFPVVTERPVMETIEPEVIPRGNGARVLFVDDEASITGMIKKMLERLDYQVQTETNPVVALERFQSKPDSFDLLLTDMTMPKMTGVILSKKIKAVRPDIPVLICTGHSALIDEKRAQSIGIDGYVMKPLTMKDIAKAIRTALKKKDGST